MKRNKHRDGSHGANEDRIIHDIDERDEWVERLTDEEWQAGRIVHGIDQPDTKHTRRWALKIWKEVTEAHLVAKASAHAMRSKNLDSCMDLFPYFVAHAKQAMELTGANDGPIEIMVHEPTYEQMLGAAVIAMEETKRMLEVVHDSVPTVEP